MRLIEAPLLILLVVLHGGLANAATTDDSLRPALAAREDAEKAEAALLAPIQYGQGITALERAQRDDPGNPEAVAAHIAAATEAFSGAARSAGEAQRVLAGALAKRGAARDAEAFRLAAASWIKAEAALGDAARRLEKSGGDAGRERAQEASELYGQAELQAIKATVLTEARGLVVGLGPANTARLAPKTTARAQALLRQAEAELDADRTRREEAARLAGEAAAEARHAVALADYLRAEREADASAEDAALAWEAALARTAGAAGNAVDLGNGPRKATDELVASVSELQKRSLQQAQELQQRDRQIAALEEEMRDLDRRLAGASNEARDLTERLEAREHAREQYQRLEQVFPTDQAIVFRQGDAMIVRAQGLAFASGSARLTPAAAPMVARLREVVEIYPGAQFTVEGHTDSSGDSGANQRLSQARAEAVRKYLVEDLQVPGGRVTAIGYGDSRPIAKNESEEGRRLNRRIDLVITPPGDDASP